MTLLLVATARALTLEEAVARAAEVNPGAVVAELEWKKTQLEAAEAWTALGPSPALSVTRTWSSGAAADRFSFQSQLVDLTVANWFDAARRSAEAGAARWTSEATTLDAQYAAAALYFSVGAANAALDAARQTEAAAEATVRASRARVSAGLESELLGRSAEIGLLDAKATTAGAEAEVEIARARLARALQQDVGELSPPPALALPAEAEESPWLRASAEAVTAARLEHGSSFSGLFPTAGIEASTPLWQTDWQLALTGTWTFDGIAGPFLRERQSALDVRIARTQYEALQRDLALGLSEARAQARAAARVAEAGRAREALATDSLRVGQTRLEVGLASTLEVLRLQDDAAAARSARVQAELAEALAVLEARRVAGVGW